MNTIIAVTGSKQAETTTLQLRRNSSRKYLERIASTVKQRTAARINSIATMLSPFTLRFPNIKASSMVITLIEESMGKASLRGQSSLTYKSASTSTAIEATGTWLFFSNRLKLEIF